ncbi:MAG: phosphoenolpyruvate synthase/pyruvate phosphate dikinase [Desulfobacteraceae bacterium]|nr:phosphoenolpyruvate synthase/pyruvate phosphate dikinase [Desulfobacteraceae bacterium]
MKSDPLNPKLSYMACEFDTHFKVFHELMANKVSEIMLVASAYDAYILEEDGSLASKIINEYHGLNLSRPPRLTHVDNTRRALELLKTENFDLVITMPHLEDTDPFEFGRTIKAIEPELPVILLAHSLEGLFPLPTNKDISGIDEVFVWSGDAELLLAIVKNVEDRLNVENDTQRAQVRVIILVEDSPLYKSYFLPLMYRQVVNQTQAVLEESLNEEHRLLKMRARPKILVADTYEKAMQLYERYHSFLFGVVSDTRFPKSEAICADAGYQLLLKIKDTIRDLPLLLLSSEPENRTKAEQIPAKFLDKNSPDLFTELRNFFLNNLGFGDFVFRNPDGSEIARASNLRQLEIILPMIPDESLLYHALRNRFSNWIMARSEIVLASRLRKLQVSDFPDIEAIRQFLTASIHSLRKWRQKGVVIQFNARYFDPGIADFVKIGPGSLGGKARGLAFVANLLRQSPGFYEKYKEISVQIPRTLVITTTGFDQFVSENRLNDFLDEASTDEKVQAAFLDARMPGQIVSDLKAYLDQVRYPLSVRSSSLLEDAHHQPLAGLYKTYMIANNHPDDHQRLQSLVRAIKMVYASTWFDLPRRFTRSTAFLHRKETMGVMIQQITGRCHDGYFYPSISGLARSQNYYPIGNIEPEDGMCKIALGFGTIIDSGAGGLRFCPKYPKMLPDFSKTEDILANAQQQFYALAMELTDASSGKDGLYDLACRNIADALSEEPVMELTSTYIAQEDRIRDSGTASGTKLVTFASVLKHTTFPLAELITDLLEIGRKGLGCNVEIEFAVNLGKGAKQPAEFNILQIRPMSDSDPLEVEILDEDKANAVCYSAQALGHGKNERMFDIVYVKLDTFDISKTIEMAAGIRKLNAILKSAQAPYLLIGPGRWGSFDRWLGIPVKWDDISGAGAIVELRIPELNADASQGSHFFQQISTQAIPYLTISQAGNDFLHWKQIETFPAVFESTYLRHVHLPEPLSIKCDGRSSQCIIMPKNISS